MRLNLLAMSCLASCLAISAGAQSKDTLDRRDKLHGYEAVGLLKSDAGSCTGALITRDVVLTAAHCVHEKGTSFSFHSGFYHGSAIAIRTADDVVIASGYLQAKNNGDRLGEIRNDVALIRLNSPIFEPGADPYKIEAAPTAGTDVTLVSYGEGRMDALTLERDCQLTTIYRGNILGMNCSATFGSSGAPVFTHANGQKRIVSVMSGITDTESYGVELSTIVPELMQRLRNKRSLVPTVTTAKRLTVGDRSGGSIRFIRPD